mgnify:CR=1 FL=1
MMNDGKTISISKGRHPVIETMMQAGEEFVPNDIYLDNESQQIIILTGPNMAGKSALLRQTALIVLMAQVGSFVPASSATIGYCDKIFTRVGASDNISRGESTFMVEMLETSMILHNLSSRSLVLLDEIGRGTSTYDGMSIAKSVLEYVVNKKTLGAKVLFATHYHELTSMEEQLSLLTTLVPDIKTLGVIYNSSEANSLAQVQELKREADKNGIDIKEISVTTVNEINQNLNAAIRARELEAEKMILNAQLAESRISTMMSQIRPHFIYNTLLRQIKCASHLGHLLVGHTVGSEAHRLGCNVNQRRLVQHINLIECRHNIHIDSKYAVLLPHNYIVIIEFADSSLCEIYRAGKLIGNDTQTAWTERLGLGNHTPQQICQHILLQELIGV